MGLFDRPPRQSNALGVRWRPSRSLPYVDVTLSFGSFQWTNRRAPVLLPPDARWYGPSEVVEVAGLRLPGGMIYVGQSLPSPNGWNEPSLIVPDRRVNLRRPDRDGQFMYMRLSYESMARTSRGAYLEWLAEGRRNPSTSASYALLFLCGLERRVLVDIAENDALAGELPAIRAEATALLCIYGDRDYQLAMRARDFINLIDLTTDALTGDAIGDPPPLVARTWSVPLGLQVGLGRLVAARRPIPADWALAWGWYSPDVPLRAPMERCPDVFSRLFAIRYRERFGDGLTVRAGKRQVTFHYHPANFTLTGGSLELPGVPDVFHHTGPAKKLALLFAGVGAELDTYSRWIGYAPERARLLPALARLPPVLLDDPVEELGRFRTWVDERLDGQDRAVLEGSVLVAQWQPAGPDRLTKPEAQWLAQLLGHLGFGIEPDVRFGGQPPAAGRSVALFRLAEGAPTSATAAHDAATVLAQVALAAIGADAPVTGQEASRLAARIGAVMRLGNPERARLDAHVALLASGELKLTGLTRRLDALGETGRAAIGEMLLALVTEDGAVSPAGVTMLMKIFRTLKLDPSSVPGRLHDRMTAPRPNPAHDPVVVRTAGAGEPGFRLPSRDPTTEAGRDVALDAAAIRQRLADSEAVSALLGSIFAEPDEPGAGLATPVGDAHRAPSGREPAPDSGAADGGTFAGLDLPHSRLLRELLTRDAWTRAEFDALAGRHGLLPAGALDTLNEAALDAAEEPLVEGDAHLAIDHDVARELLR